MRVAKNTKIKVINYTKRAQKLLNDLDDVGAGSLLAFRSRLVIRAFEEIKATGLINKKLACPRCGPKMRKRKKKFLAEIRGNS